MIFYFVYFTNCISRLVNQHYQTVWEDINFNRIEHKNHRVQIQIQITRITIFGINLSLYIMTIQINFCF